MSRIGVGEKWGRIAAAAMVVGWTILPPSLPRSVNHVSTSTFDVLGNYSERRVAECNVAMQQLLIPEGELMKIAGKNQLRATPWDRVDVGCSRYEVDPSSSAWLKDDEVGLVVRWKFGNGSPEPDYITLIVNSNGGERRFVEFDLKRLRREGIRPDRDLKLGLLRADNRIGVDGLVLVVGYRTEKNGFEFELTPTEILFGLKPGQRLG